MATAPSSQASLLLQKQLKDLCKHPVDGFSAGLVNEDNIFEWNVTIIGPPDTLYEGGFFNAIMSFPEDYPCNPPIVRFTSEMWHPNVYADGKVCVSILHPPGDDPNGYELATERWNPVHTVESILLSIISMLSSPNDESPANVDAAVGFFFLYLLISLSVLLSIICLALLWIGCWSSVFTYRTTWYKCFDSGPSVFHIYQSPSNSDLNLLNQSNMALSGGLLLPISSIIILISLAYKLYQRLRFKLPPGPRAWPIVGNLYDIKPVRFRCYAEWAQEYGPIISVWTGSTLNVVVSSSELAKEVLKEHDQKLADRHRSRSAAKFSKDGQDLIWADYGPHYVKVRKVCTLELFSPKRIEALRPIREDEVTAMVESIFKHCANPENYGKSLLVKKYLGAVAFNNITRLAFGKRFVNSEDVIDEQGLEFKAIVANGLKLGASLAMAEHIPWLRWMFPLEEEAFAKHGARRDRLTRAIMEEHTQARNESGGAKQHFVDALLTLQDKYDLSEDTIIGLLWDMITAGMDTTAISVEWAMAELIKNPRVQQKAQEELDGVIGVERVMTEVDFSSLPYLQCVAKEALRLHPPTPLMLPHRANANVNIGGYDIPKGSNVHVNVWAVARDPAVWKDPYEFRPERFLEEDVDMKGHDFRLLPFGAGRRVCPGAQLGINLVTSMLGHLLHHFNWTPAEGAKPEEIDMSENPGLVTYMRTPLQAVPTPRLPSQLYKRVAADM